MRRAQPRWRNRAWTCSGGRATAAGRFSVTWPTTRLRDAAAHKCGRGLADAGSVGRRIRAAGPAALAARLPADQRNRDAGNAILPHFDRAKQRQLAAIEIGLQLARADLLPQHRVAAADRVELDR